MAKVTSKLQVTIPKALAEQYRISPGDEIEWQAAGEAIRVAPVGRTVQRKEPEARLLAFDKATARRDERQGGRRAARSRSRGWRREDLYDRARAR